MTTADSSAFAPPPALGTARMDVAAPFAAAMRAHAQENWPQLLAVEHAQSGQISWMTTATWFGQEPHKEQIIDHLIANTIRGPVLDVGAGAGRAALKLQSAGIEVVALDCEPACIELLRAKGVQHVVHADIRTYETEQRFRTILFMDSTFGLIGDVEEAGALLSKLRSLLTPDGAVLVQDAGVSPPVNQLEWRFAFRNEAGPYFHWLNFSFSGLKSTVAKHGWAARRVGLMVGPYFVAELQPADDATTSDQALHPITALVLAAILGAAVLGLAFLLR